MRKALAEYLQEEGLKCDIENGDVVFEFNECKFTAMFSYEEGYAECNIFHKRSNEDYKNMPIDKKTFLADKVNAVLENHTSVVAYDESLLVVTSFYFTSRSMLFGLFSRHFEELTETLCEVCDRLSPMTAKNKPQSRPIGFCADSEESADETDEGQFAASTK